MCTNILFYKPEPGEYNSMPSETDETQFVSIQDTLRKFSQGFISQKPGEFDFAFGQNVTDDDLDAFVDFDISDDLTQIDEAKMYVDEFKRRVEQIKEDEKQNPAKRSKNKNISPEKNKSEEVNNDDLNDDEPRDE